MSHTHVVSQHVSQKDLADIINQFGVTEFVTEAKNDKAEPLYRKVVDPAEVKANGSTMPSILNNLAYTLNKKQGFLGEGRATSGAPRSTSNGGGKKESGEATSAVWKLAAEFNEGNSTVALTFGKIGDGDKAVAAVASYDAESSDLVINASVIRYFSRKVQAFCASPREALVAATELQNGQIVAAGFRWGEYQSTKTDPAEATTDIMQQIAGKMDMVNLLAAAAQVQAGGLTLEKTGNARKFEWLAKYMPEPEKPEAPAEPEKKPGEVGGGQTETPQTQAEVMAKADTNVGQIPAKQNAPAAPVKTEAKPEVEAKPEAAPAAAPTKVAALRARRK